MSIADLIPSLLVRVADLRTRVASNESRPSAEIICAELSQVEVDLTRLQERVRLDGLDAAAKVPPRVWHGDPIDTPEIVKPPSRRRRS